MSIRQRLRRGATACVLPMLLWSVAAGAAGIDGLAGFWQPASKVESLRPADGREPPFTAAGRESWASVQDMIKAGDRSFDNGEKCLPIGLTRLMATSPFELIAAKNEYLFVFQWNRVFHSVPLRLTHLKDYGYPAYLGHSRGEEQGRNLLIDSIYFNEDTVLDESGLPHSDQLHVSQRLQLRDANTLVSQLTIEDPVMYTRAWQATLTFKRMPGGARLDEDVCVERLGLKKLNTGKG